MYKILIVDDNKNNIQVLASTLSQDGYNIEFALNGNDAIDWVSEQTFDLILLDVMMPGIDGFETCVKIKQIDSAKDIPIIFITARTDTESISKGFISGSVDYITKPFNSIELLARVKTHIELRVKNIALAELNANLEKIVDDRTNQIKEYAFITSHNLRRPLANIIGLTSAIENANRKNLNIDNLINHLKESSNELDAVIKNTVNLLNQKDFYHGK